ncbi:sulfatase-like hydrolase/transferase [Pelagicoccus sp. SDUM812005]|uniref:sulfatase-like hydrolase/transferase n=1 Tax=Pelagicoccus sp. SDUM812005 TaxID=3041257 RepID=UPI002810581F|nr:sulfatase-like hydrolase/transferase [Pelagicoccus sp. SDUM812005]MDQ8180297.1 sulfatase-like hydrolase/transferase [Pelagicoccus sp. SDUM812005]
MRPIISKTLIYLISVCGVACSAEERPNIVVILCDDLGYADVGFNGSTDIQTPELDELAAAGTRFSSAYVSHPFCGPSRMSLLSGRYPHPMGTPYNLAPLSYDFPESSTLGIPESEVLISKVLQQSGYRTGIVGKWHLGFEPQYHPNVRGFDDFYGFLGGGHFYFPEKYKPIYERQKKAGKSPIEEYLLPLEHNGKEVDETEYITDGLSREAVRFVKESAEMEQPFFLYLSYNAPHSPLEAKEEDMEPYRHIKDIKRRKYAGMVAAVDRGVGELVDALREAGVFENTLIVFTSDNGGKTTLGANNAPLKKGKGSVSEGGIRVPMFFHWPKVVPSGQLFEHPVSTLDFYPTFADLARAEIPAGKLLDGVALLDAVKKRESPRRGDMVYAVRHRDGFSEISGRRDSWKAIWDTKGGSWRLYNVDKDMAEKNDLSAQYPERLEELKAGIRRWTATHTQPLWFHSVQEMEGWKENEMPRYDDAFGAN